MALTDLIPSMFHRRLVLLLGCTALGTGVLAGQVARLTLLQGEQHRAEAEARLVRRQWTPTLRGRILDRKGRVLAKDRPSFDVAVEFPVITGEWARRQAASAARKLHRAEWSALSTEQREALVQRYLPAFEEHLERAWDLFARTAGMTEEDLQRRRERVIEGVDRMYRVITTKRWDRELEEALARGRELDDDLERRIAGRVKQPIAEQGAPHVVAPRVQDEVGFAFLRLVGKMGDVWLPGPEGGVAVPAEVIPGLSVVNAHDREYPYERTAVDVDLSSFPGPTRAEEVRRVEVAGVATHVIGWMRGEAQAQHIEARAARIAADAAFRARVTEGVGEDRGAYRPGDAVGAAGVEASAEHVLRGLRGVRTEQLETGEKRVLEPAPGEDVRLTIDVALQARVQAAMDPALGLAVVQPWHASDNPTMPLGTPLNGGAVVLDVDTGDILALVSTPSVPRDVLRDEPEKLFEDRINEPFFHRAIARPYPPGSIAKALILAAAVKLGHHNLDHGIECNGHLLPTKPDQFRCWIFKSYNHTHTRQFGGALDAVKALTVSCNIYFFTLGQRLGPEGIEAAYRMFGLGERWGLGIGHEFEGQMGVWAPDAEGKMRTLPLTIGDAIQMGIGQGPISWTPLHAADAYATLARGGVRLRPRLTMGDLDGQGSPEPVDLGLPARAVEQALAGLSGSVNDPLGTGHHITIRDESGDRRENVFNAPGVRVWGKTGTAEAPPLRVDPDGDGPRGVEVVRSGDHSWFVVLVGPEGDRPRYAIAVMMEYAGSGGKVSGPIVNQIIHALIAEGYL